MAKHPKTPAKMGMHKVEPKAPPKPPSKPPGHKAQKGK